MKAENKTTFHTDDGDTFINLTIFQTDSSYRPYASVVRTSGKVTTERMYGDGTDYPSFSDAFYKVFSCIKKDVNSQPLLDDMEGQFKNIDSHDLQDEGQ